MTTSQATTVRHARRPDGAPARAPMQEFANRIIVELENGAKPWVRPWDPEKAAGPQAPFNSVSGKRYHGINVLILSMGMRAFQADAPRWMTFRQAQGKKLAGPEGRALGRDLLHEALRGRGRRRRRRQEDHPRPEALCRVSCVADRGRSGLQGSGSERSGTRGAARDDFVSCLREGRLRGFSLV
jgi:hypothetical protein